MPHDSTREPPSLWLSAITLGLSDEPEADYMQQQRSAKGGGMASTYKPQLAIFVEEYPAFRELVLHRTFTSKEV